MAQQWSGRRRSRRSRHTNPTYAVPRAGPPFPRRRLPPRRGEGPQAGLLKLRGQHEPSERQPSDHRDPPAGTARFQIRTSKRRAPPLTRSRELPKYRNALDLLLRYHQAKYVFFLYDEPSNFSHLTLVNSSTSSLNFNISAFAIATNLGSARWDVQSCRGLALKL